VGLFHHKQQPKIDDHTEGAASQDQFFDEYFREELRNRGRWYFEKVITENGDLFKQDLEATIANVKTELDEHVTTQVDETVKQIDEYLKAHVTRKLDEQFVQYNDALKAAQDAALLSVTESTKQLQLQHEQLKQALERSVQEQSSILHGAFEENKAEITAMKDAQSHALESLKHSAAEVEQQYKQLSTTLQQTIDAQKQMVLQAFESNMAEVVEHYVLGALGEQFDLKAQLPSIIKQMEANKAAMVEDLKL
jgi:exonuclease VII large subunit